MQQTSDQGKINSHTRVDVSTSFTTSDRNTYHTLAREKINFSYLQRLDI